MSTRPNLLLHLLIAAGILAVSGAAGTAAPATPATDAARSDIAQMSPYDVGSRYGQALGAVEICLGAQTTPKVPALNTVYTGDEFQAFKAQATKIYGAWISLKQCAIVEDPTECRLIVEESCAAAVIEIGPSGTVFPGLLEQPRR